METSEQPKVIVMDAEQQRNLPNNDKITLIREDAFLIFRPNVTASGRGKDLAHFPIWQGWIEFLVRIGFELYVKDSFKEGGQYYCLQDEHRWGLNKRNGLRFVSEIYKMGCQLFFFQELNTVNKHAGGEYDFSKYRLMPANLKNYFNRIIEQFQVEMQDKFKIEIQDEGWLQFPALTAEQQLIKHCKSYFTPKNKITALDQIEPFMSQHDRERNSLSGVNDILKCGEIRKFKYSFLDSNRKLVVKIVKGRIYHNINNMWWVIQSKYKLNNVANFEILEKVN